MQYIKDDLESAEILLKESDNYHISAYHSHQAIEKIFKAFLIRNGRKFPFIHDLKQLFSLVSNVKRMDHFLDDVLYIDDLYPQLRYPTGDKVSKEEAEKSLAIAKKIFIFVEEAK